MDNLQQLGKITSILVVNKITPSMPKAFVFVLPMKGAFHASTSQLSSVYIYKSIRIYVRWVSFYVNNKSINDPISGRLRYSGSGETLHDGSTINNDYSLTTV